MRVYELKQMISAFDNYYTKDMPNKYYISNNYIEVADLCNALMLNDKAEGNY
tara:strand:+ start:133 stop:288 length:156 start_codon:yes stop_codon:yes gene_type:complete